jgi:hypothetical protein
VAVVEELSIQVAVALVVIDVQYQENILEDLQQQRLH